jgi:shikimate kinase
MLKNIYIIGPLGAGKSSVGKYLAKLLKRPFYDSDREVEKRSGVNIEWMFDVEGEAGFKAREQTVVEDLSKEEGIVLATGGGTVENPVCREALANGIVIYIQVAFEEQATRVKRFPWKRPQLRSADPEQKLLELNEQREQLYASIADYSYVNSNKNPYFLARKIVKDIAADDQ